ncbi:MAG TPA: metal ABC transporter permease [Candidatus Dojkabacteria bacterium]
MFRAYAGGLFVAVLCGLIGVFVVLRKQSFIADGIAHASLSGVAFALVLSFQPFVPALLAGILMAVLITFLQKKTKISSDALIGIIFSVMFALGIIILNLSDSYQPEISTYLFGSILSISIADLFYSFVLLIIILITVSVFFKKILYVTFDKNSAFVRGIKTDLIEYIINILIATTVIVSIKMVGIILVSALLIIPAASAKLIAKNFSQMIPLSIAQSLISTAIGIIVAVILDVPVGATIVVTSGIIFIILVAYKSIISK